MPVYKEKRQEKNGHLASSTTTKAQEESDREKIEWQCQMPMSSAPANQLQTSAPRALFVSLLHINREKKQDKSVSLSLFEAFCRVKVESASMDGFR